MRVYLELMRLAFRQQVAYRAATVAGIFTNSVFGVILTSVMLAFYRSVNGATVAGWSPDEAVTLIWINQALLMPVYIWGWWEVSRSIQTGTIATDFLRPISWYGLWVSRDAGRGAAAILLRLLPTMTIGWLLYDIAPPASAGRAAAFMLAVVLAIWVSFSIRLLTNLASFWLIDHRGIAGISMAIGTFLSGVAMPIDYFPEPLRAIAAVLPFQAVIMAPNNVYLAKEPLWQVAGGQLFWVVALGVACQATLRRGERRLVVHGG